MTHVTTDNELKTNNDSLETFYALLDRWYPEESQVLVDPNENIIGYFMAITPKGYAKRHLFVFQDFFNIMEKKYQFCKVHSVSREDLTEILRRQKVLR